jgi:hypothetical protein
MSVFVGRVCTRVYEYLHLYSVSEKNICSTWRKKTASRTWGRKYSWPGSVGPIDPVCRWIHEAQLSPVQRYRFLLFLRHEREKMRTSAPAVLVGSYQPCHPAAAAPIGGLAAGLSDGDVNRHRRVHESPITNASWRRDWWLRLCDVLLCWVCSTWFCPLLHLSWWTNWFIRRVV